MLRALVWQAFTAANRWRFYRDQLDRFQMLSPSEGRKELGHRLLAQLRYFGSRADALPEWREAARATSPEDAWRIWPTLPVVTKQDLQGRFHPKEIQSRLGLTGHVSSTGGSTGEPTPYLLDAETRRAQRAALVYSQLHMGWHPSMALVCVWGSNRDIGRHQTTWQGRLSAYIRSMHLIGGYRLTPETTDAVVALVRRYKSVAMYGFTSMLEFVARDILERALEVPLGHLRVAWNGGEMLFEQQAEFFQQAFGVPLLNFYGSRELAAMAFQPRAGAPLSILRPLLFTEIVDDRGHPVGPGEEGRLLWTSTTCRGTPFLRYDIGDLATYRAEDADESGVRALAQLRGRVGGLLRLPNGKTIQNIFWNHLFKEYSEVQQFQVVARKDGSLLLRLKGMGFTAEQEAPLRTVLGDLLGSVQVELAWVDEIPLTTEGKLLQVVRE